MIYKLSSNSRYYKKWTKSFHAREAILRYLGDVEDTFIAIERLETPAKRWTLAELEND